MKPIVLVGCSEDFQRQVVAAAGESILERLRRWSDPVARSGTVAGLLSLDPSVVVLGDTFGEEEALRIAAELDQIRRGISVVLVAKQRPQTLNAALAAGVRAVVPPDSVGAALRLALIRAAEAGDRAVSTPAAPPGGQVPAPLRTGKVITVSSPKGGAGKTVLASNLAARLAQQHPRRVAVVDLDLQFGDIAFALSLSPRHSIKDAAASTGVNTTALKVFLTPHPAGLYALCAPSDPADGDDVDPVATGEVLTRLAEEFDYVVIDTGAGLTEHTLAALDVSTDVVLVADADVPSIRHMAKVVKALDGLQMDALTRHFILNRADARIGIRIGDVLDGVGLKTDLEIPTSREVGISLSKGEPIVLSNAKSAMAKRVAQLAERIGASDESGRKAERSAS
jgi:pilus assembly protein CpaE